MTVRDRYALHPGDGKIAAPGERFDVVVVGTGEAGTAAAIAATQGGASVLLVDENPVPPGLMGTDVPLLFGGRMTAAVQAPGRMIETLFLTNPALEAAFDAGVDVRLGTAAWGLYVAGPGLRTLPTPMLGLADAERSSMVGFDRLVLATGARDAVLGFPGWDQPGVVGAQGFHALLTRYDALASRRVAIVGAGDLALRTALLAVARGIEVCGVIAGVGVAASAALLAEVRVAGIAIYTETTIAATHGGIDGVSGVTLRSRDREWTIACDTVVLAIATIPATELLDASGAAADRAITRVGDCAAPPPDPALLAAWAAALGRHAADDTIVCQCEGVTRGDLLGVQPPSYLDRPAALAARSLATLARDGAAHPDQIKRLTRAGMGACQGRRCREAVACLLAAATGVRVEQVPVATQRAPVRPVPLAVLADWNETAAMADGWDVWFGIPTQWTPYADIGTDAEFVGGNRHV